MHRFEIDYNDRAPDGLNRLRFPGGDAPFFGERIVVFQPEDGTCADALVAHVDLVKGLAHVAVDWGSLRDDA